MRNIRNLANCHKCLVTINVSRINNSHNDYAFQHTLAVIVTYEKIACLKLIFAPTEVMPLI